jgi:hypothetical protein
MLHIYVVLMEMHKIKVCFSNTVLQDLDQYKMAQVATVAQMKSDK